MEDPPLPEIPIQDYSSNVDTSRPFRSVKEAVAIFGDRLLVGETYSPKPYVHVPIRQEAASWNNSPSPVKPRLEDNEHLLFGTLKKLEAELEETKVELKMLKERESETEVALASLNAELHKNMSKLAEAEAVAAAKAVATRDQVSHERPNSISRLREEEKRPELMQFSMEDSPTLTQILSFDEEGYFGRKQLESKRMKKKPIIPLVGDLFSRKKRSSSAQTALHNPLYSSPNLRERCSCGGEYALILQRGPTSPRTSVFLFFSHLQVAKAVATPNSAVELPLTAENVESVLDEIRPYLIADGGNVALHEIDGNVVRLKLQGACGSCPSSVMTMKMGIERRLMEKIPEIVAVEPIADEETGLELNAENIEKPLEVLVFITFAFKFFPHIVMVNVEGGYVEVNGATYRRTAKRPSSPPNNDKIFQKL
ncbi:NifU-like protein 2, chloroplastic [Morella rubra]|uniref:NifU-like protein 2, chloroplastic n=1 Tax=Morella rubra TaxID=262757 RepID=A0A6A1WQ67_9ROSI|nr:NifU-like protein 2, chloroplastic [Morella rubra]